MYIHIPYIYMYMYIHISHIYMYMCVCADKKNISCVYV